MLSSLSLYKLLGKTFGMIYIHYGDNDIMPYLSATMLNFVYNYYLHRGGGLGPTSPREEVDVSFFWFSNRFASHSCCRCLSVSMALSTIDI